MRHQYTTLTYEIRQESPTSIVCHAKRVVGNISYEITFGDYLKPPITGYGRTSLVGLRDMCNEMLQDWPE